MKFFRILVSLAVFFSLVQTTSAHERRVYEVNGKQYLFVIGSLNEPVYTGDKSGFDFRVKLADPVDPGNSSSPNALPVEGLEKELRAEIQVDGEKYEMELSPVYKKPGEYSAVFYPQVASQYAYRVFGTIHGVPFDQTFACNTKGHVMSGGDHQMNEQISDGVRLTLHAGSFGCPKDRDEVSFPLQRKDVGGNIPLILSIFAVGFSGVAVWRRKG
jgi:hypothetical protein